MYKRISNYYEMKVVQQNKAWISEENNKTKCNRFIYKAIYNISILITIIYITE